MDLSEKFYIVRKEIALNQREAAEKAGLKQATISIIERGERNNLPSTYLDFLYQKGIDLNWIFNNDNNIAHAFRNNTNNHQPARLVNEELDSASGDDKFNDIGKAEIKVKPGFESINKLDAVLNQLLHEIEKLNATLLTKL